MKRFIATILSVIIIIFQINVTFAESDVNTPEIPVIVEERAGVEGIQTIERGLLLPNGFVTDINDIILIDDNETNYPIQAECTEKWENGSIKWISAAFQVELDALETKKLKIVRGRQKTAKQVSVEKKKGGYLLSNGSINVSVSSYGIDYIEKNNKMLVNEIGMYAQIYQIDKTYNLSDCSIDIMREGDVLATVRLKGIICDELEAEWLITLTAGSDIVHNEFRYITKDDVIMSTIALSCNMGTINKYSYNEDAPIYRDGEIIGADWISCNDAMSKVSFVSHDVERFRGGMGKDDSGYMIHDNKIDFAPIICKNKFSFYDGMSRTAKIDILFEGDEESHLSVLKKSASAIHPPEYYKSCGILQSTFIPDFVRVMIDEFKSDDSYRYARYEAGGIPTSVDSYMGRVGMFEVRHGETDFHLSYAYMLTGDSDLYDIIMEDAECFADCSVYRGKFDILYGANRYRTGRLYDAAQFRRTHPFYGDATGIYQSYLISGRRYFEETFHIMTDHLVINANSAKNMGLNVPRMIDWTSGEPTLTNYVECRYMMSIRALYIAEKRYGGGQYEQVCKNIALWAKNAQTEKGFWYQAYRDSGELLYQSGQNQPPIKNYLMLYGGRGLIDYYLMSGDENAGVAVKKLADYFLEERVLPSGYLMNVSKDKTYERNEDGSRGQYTFINMMATDYMFDAYSITGDKRYLEAMIQFLRYWLAQQLPGGFLAQSYDEYGYGNSVSPPFAALNMNIFSLVDRLDCFFRNNEDRVKSIQGGEDLLIAWYGSRTPIKHSYIYKSYNYEVTANLFEYNGEKVAYFVNNSGAESGLWTKNLSIKPDRSGGIWTNAKNKLIYENETYLEKTLDQFEAVYSVQLPLKLKNQTDVFYANVLQNDDNGYVIEFEGKGSADLVYTGKGRAEFKANGKRVEVILHDDYNQNSVFTINFGNASIIKADDWIANDIVNAYNNELASPESIIAAETFVGIVEENLHVKVQNKYTGTLNKQKAEAILLEGLDLAGELLNIGIKSKKFTVLPLYNSDKDIVDVNYKILDVKEKEIYESMQLITDGVCGAKIEWQSSHPDIIDSTGKIIERPLQNTEVLLKAIISKGGAKREKEFTVSVMDKYHNLLYARGYLKKAMFHIDVNDDHKIEFDVTPLEDRVNVFISFGDEDVIVHDYREVLAFVRFRSSDSTIVCRDAGSSVKYKADNVVKYKKNHKYHFVLTYNVEEQLYSVYVTPEGGEPIALAVDYPIKATKYDSSPVLNMMYLDVFNQKDKVLKMTYNSCLTSDSLKEEFDVKKEEEESDAYLDKYVVNEVLLPSGSFSSRPDILSNEGLVRHCETETELTVYMPNEHGKGGVEKILEDSGFTLSEDITGVELQSLIYKLKFLGGK